MKECLDLELYAITSQFANHYQSIFHIFLISMCCCEHVDNIMPLYYRVVQKFVITHIIYECENKKKKKKKVRVLLLLVESIDSLKFLFHTF